MAEVNKNAELYDRYGISADGLSVKGQKAAPEGGQSIADELGPLPEPTGQPGLDPAPEPQDAESETPAAPESAEPAADTHLEKARDVIARKFGGNADSMIAGMDENSILALGTQLSADLKKHGDLANELDRLKKGKPENERHDSEETGQGGEDAARPPESPKGPDISDAVGSLDEVLHEGLPEALTGIAQKLVEHGDKTLVEAIRATEERMEAKHLEVVDAQVRRDLGNRFPDIQDPELLVKVKATMQVLEPGMEYTEAEDVFARRSRLMTYAIAIHQPNALQGEERPTRSKGGPRPPRQAASSSPKRELSVREKAHKYVALKAEGLSTEVARQRVGY